MCTMQSKINGTRKINSKSADLSQAIGSAFLAEEVIWKNITIHGIFLIIEKSGIPQALINPTNLSKVLESI